MNKECDFINCRTMKLNYIKYILLLVIGLTSNNLIAQYSPLFSNYSLSKYNAGNQNWDISIANNGKIYVANNNGLLEYDGINWNLSELPNKTTIRSVLAHENKIYTGSYEEFGFWEKNTKGELNYTSISNKFKLEESLNEEFWQILSFKNTFVFRSFLNLYIYENKEIRKIKPKSTVISCDVIDDKLYVSTLKDGIYTLDRDTLVPFINDDALRDTKVISISKHNSNLLITTSLKGSYILDNKKLIPVKSEINNLIKQYQLNSFSKLDNGNMVFGTIKNGIYFTNSSGKIIFHLNKEKGLINNTILSQTVIDNHKIWLGLDNGLASINLFDHSSYYNDASGALGAVYDVIKFKETIYIGSNTGLYYLDKKNKLQFVKNSQGQVWDLKEINGELFCGHNNGTYIVDNNKIKLISSFTGGWTIKKVPEKENSYIQGTYAGLVSFKKENEKWHIKHLGKTTIPVRFLTFEDQNTAWAAHAYKGLYKITFNNNHDSIINIIDYKNKGIGADYNIRVNKFKNSICFKTNNGWQKYESLLDSIVPYNLLNEKFGKDSYIISEDDTKQLVLKNNNGIIVFKSLSNNEEDLFITNKYFNNRLIVGYENVSQINDSIYALNLNDGFMLINTLENINLNNNLYKPSIEKIMVNNKLLDLNTSNIIELPNNKNTISISISSAKSSNHFFEYCIPSLDSLKWHKVEKEKLELSNLKSGDFSILFRTSNNSGLTSKITPLEISVLPPWYKSNIGYAIFGFILLFLIALFNFLHKRKIKKEQKLLQINFQNSQKELLKEKSIENDKKIVELRNESLQNEIKLKSKQLANTAMALVKKNEILQEIKKELLLHKNSFDNVYTFKKLQKKIDNSIEHEDEWEIFEYNFNQVHDEFFKQLKEKHSSLNPKDLKICAYIKMNLTNKEIAPLINISTRGVETQRYRLKKKLNLGIEISLSDYLQSFK